MKIVEVKIVPGKLEMTPQAKEWARMVRDPQDLNEALASVRSEESIKKFLAELRAKEDARNRTMLESFFFP